MGGARRPLGDERWEPVYAAKVRILFLIAALGAAPQKKPRLRPYKLTSMHAGKAFIFPGVRLASAGLWPAISGISVQTNTESERARYRV
jgi:hypothetical protein